MKKESLRVLDLLEQGKITADDATKLLAALKSNESDCECEFNSEEVESKLNEFSKSVDSFAKDFGDKLGCTFKGVEPKIKGATKTVIEKTAAVMNEISKSLNETLKNMETTEQEDTCCCNEQEADKEPCCEKTEDSCCSNDNEPKEN